MIEGLLFGDGGKAPPVLLPYQQAWVADKSEVKVCEKSRRIGLTWAEAADDVLLAATEGRGGMDVLYISYNQEMTREYIDTCAFWARHFNKAAGEIEEFLFEDEDKDIKAFRITFSSGYEILALSSSPKNLRGKQGRLIIDEAAFVELLKELLKAAMAYLMWGGQVIIISSDNGDTSDFNELIEDIRAQKKPYSLHRITFSDAIADGLYKRICLVRGLPWTPEEEADWEAKIRKLYGEDAAEELDCIPSRGAGIYLTRQLIESCMSPDIPVLRWESPAADFVDWPDDRRHREMRDWLEAFLGPILAGLPKGRPHFVGEDFARADEGDLSVVWPLTELENLVLTTPFVLEYRGCPFRQQEQGFFYVCDRFPLFSGGALDSRGNGEFLGEVARQRYGPELIAQVKESESWYRENMPKLKAAFEDKTIVVPQDSLILDDLRAFKVTKGVAKLPDKRAGAKGEKRHGDAGMAAALAVYAAKCIEAEPFQVISAAPYRSTTLFRGYR